MLYEDLSVGELPRSMKPSKDLKTLLKNAHLPKGPPKEYSEEAIRHSQKQKLRYAHRKI